MAERIAARRREHVAAAARRRAPVGVRARPDSELRGSCQAVMAGLPGYSLLEPSVLTFVLIPVGLVMLLTWGVWAAWRCAGRPPASARLAALTTVAGAVLWLDVTWSLA